MTPFLFFRQVVLVWLFIGMITCWIRAMQMVIWGPTELAQITSVLGHLSGGLFCLIVQTRPA